MNKQKLKNFLAGVKKGMTLDRIVAAVINAILTLYFVQQYRNQSPWLLIAYAVLAASVVHLLREAVMYYLRGRK